MGIALLIRKEIVDKVAGMTFLRKAGTAMRVIALQFGLGTCC